LQAGQRIDKITTASSWGNIDFDNTAGMPVDTLGRTLAKQRMPLPIYSTAQHVVGWPPLPGTKQEINSIDFIFRQAGIHNALFTDSFATEQIFKSQNGKSAELLHIATHGFFFPAQASSNPINKDDSQLPDLSSLLQNSMIRSGLVLAGGNKAWTGNLQTEYGEDGILTAYEIAQMDLSNTNLVVLSACETALGDIAGDEGVIGLQRAFRIAGVKQLMLSLWQVPDKETIELMVKFYSNLFAGQPTAEALRNAQLKMNEKYPPFYWAGFILVQ
jgi:CHAT domain-containing protein